MISDVRGLHDRISDIADEMAPEMIRVRRHLHRYPELSLHESETTRFVSGKLKARGLQPRIFEQGIGLTCDWQAGPQTGAMPRIGLRADLDALPIQTTSDADYRSTVCNVMHACGHDAHTAMVYGALAILERLKHAATLPVPLAVRAIFQPAEETSQGGPLVIEAGALVGLSGAFALHVDPTLSVGHVATRIGFLTAGCDTFEAKFLGTSGHSARPFQAVDVIEAATSWVQQIYSRAPRVHDCRDPAVISFGTIQAGKAANVIADTGLVRGTVRTLSLDTRARLLKLLREIADAIESSHGCKIELAVIAHTPSLTNAPALTQCMIEAAGRLEDVDSVSDIPLPSMGAEDFAFYSQQIPTCMMRLGTGIASAAGEYPIAHLHASDFDIDERALKIGAQVLAAAVINWSLHV